MRVADHSAGQAGAAERTWCGRRWSLKEEEKSGGEGRGEQSQQSEWLRSWKSLSRNCAYVCESSQMYCKCLACLNATETARTKGQMAILFRRTKNAIKTDLNDTFTAINCWHYIFIVYFFAFLCSTRSDLPFCSGNHQEVVSRCEKKSCIYLHLRNSSVKRCFCCFIFPPTEDRRWCDIRSIQVKDIGHGGIPPPLLSSATQSQHSSCQRCSVLLGSERAGTVLKINGVVSVNCSRDRRSG